MGKVKSAICLVLATLLIAALSFVCFVPFHYGTGGMYEFDPIITWTAKESNLGVQFGAGDGEYYIGGGYSATYYPDGVISAREYEDNLSGMEETKQEEYIAKYTKIGALYFEEEHVEDGKVSETFRNDFATALSNIKKRYARMNIEGLRMDVVDDYTVRVFVPQTASAGSGYASLFSMFAYSGDLEVRYGTDEASATTIIPTLREPDIGTFISDAYTLSDATGNNYVVVKFTSEGKNILSTQTASASDSSSGVLLFKMGEDTVIQLTISETITDSRIYISNPSSPFSSEQAKALSVLFDSAIEGEQSPLSFSYEDAGTYRALGGDNALMFLYIAFGICFVGMMAFFFARYHLLGFVHLYTYLLFLLITILCLWGIPFISLNMGTLAAVLLMSLVLSFSQVAVYEKARKDRATGKTMSMSIKSAYKKCFWHIFDVHIVLALIGFLTYGIALSGLSAFGFVLGLTAVFSGICSLAVGRFLWAVMMSFTRNQNFFCNFKGKEEKING